MDQSVTSEELVVSKPFGIRDQLGYMIGNIGTI